jgi:hypothetical protein
MLSVVNLTFLALAATGVVRFLLLLLSHSVVRTRFWGGAAMLGAALLALLATALVQIGLWAVVFLWCGELGDFERLLKARASLALRRIAS